MSKIILVPFLLVYLLVATASVSVLQFTASVEGMNPNEITLRWSVQNESMVDHYRIDRRMDHSYRENYARIGRGESYEFVDRNIFKSSAEAQSIPIEYELFAVLTNNTTISLAKAEVSYTTNAVRRTWGNIKSMFQ